MEITNCEIPTATIRIRESRGNAVALSRCVVASDIDRVTADDVAVERRAPLEFHNSIRLHFIEADRKAACRAATRNSRSGTFIEINLSQSEIRDCPTGRSPRRRFDGNTRSQHTQMPIVHDACREMPVEYREIKAAILLRFDYY